MLAVPALLTACSNDNENTPTKSEIRLKSDVWKMMEGTRATTFDDATALQGEAHFTCAAYEANTLTAYISPTTVDWNSTYTRWEFNNGASHYYWPTTGNLDFFGYMPKAGSLPSYITADPGPTYTADHDVTFTCTSLPMTSGDQASLKEFIYGIALGQNKDNASSGVPLEFQHPFCRIKLQMSASQPKEVTINSITLKSIQNNGSFLYDYSETTSTWTPTDDATNFVATLGGGYAAGAAIGTYIMIPQAWGGEIEVSASWKEWGETIENEHLTTTVSTTWQPGYSYTYSFTISDYDLKVNVEKFTEQW